MESGSGTRMLLELKFRTLSSSRNHDNISATKDRHSTVIRKHSDLKFVNPPILAGRYSDAVSNPSRRVPLKGPAPLRRPSATNENELTRHNHNAHNHNKNEQEAHPYPTHHTHHSHHTQPHTHAHASTHPYTTRIYIHVINAHAHACPQSHPTRTPTTNDTVHTVRNTPVVETAFILIPHVQNRQCVQRGNSRRDGAHE